MCLLCVPDIVAPWKVSIIPNPADPPAESELIREAHAAGLAVVAYTFRSDVHFLHEVSGAETHAHTQAQASSLSGSLMPPSPLLACLLVCSRPTLVRAGLWHRIPSCKLPPPSQHSRCPHPPTGNASEEYARFFQLGIDGVFSDFPRQVTHVCVKMRAAGPSLRPRPAIGMIIGYRH